MIKLVYTEGVDNMSDLSYTNEQGQTVFTSQYFRNRGTCCKSNCLHCPYGTTLKNLGVQFSKVEDIEVAKEILKGKEEKTDNLTSSLLSSAFGSKPKKKAAVITEEDKDKFLFVFLKEVLCGVAKTDGRSLSSLYLKDEFNDQGLSQDIVESYLN